MFERTPSLRRRFFYSHLLCALSVAFAVALYLLWSFRQDLLQQSRAQLATAAVAISERMPKLNLDDVATGAQVDTALTRSVQRFGLKTAVLIKKGQPERRYGVESAANNIDMVFEQDYVDAKGAVWHLQLTRSGEEQANRFRTIAINALTGFIGAVLIAFLLSTLLSRDTTQLLNNFAERFSQIAGGNFSGRIQKFNDPQLNLIAQSFNAMTEKLSVSMGERDRAVEQMRKARDQLEQNVKDRSRELDQLNNVLRDEHEQRARLEATLAEAAATDSLTKLLNRRAMQELISEVAKVLRVQAKGCCFATLDIDHFKQINDRFGHDVGDEVLAKVSEMLRKQARSDEAVARWGGEEFLLFWPDQTTAIAERRAERIRELINEQQFAKGELKVTASIGISHWDCNEKLEDALKRSDKALYQAKSEGRNRVRLHKGVA
jgi:diguanylate cyclase (GGDEF)-like protein